jgi:hypothetical protein
MKYKNISIYYIGLVRAWGKQEAGGLTKRCAFLYWTQQQDHVK